MTSKMPACTCISSSATKPVRSRSGSPKIPSYGSTTYRSGAPTNCGCSRSSPAASPSNEPCTGASDPAIFAANGSRPKHRASASTSAALCTASSCSSAPGSSASNATSGRSCRPALRAVAQSAMPSQNANASSAGSARKRPESGLEVHPKTSMILGLTGDGGNRTHARFRLTSPSPRLLVRSSWRPLGLVSPKFPAFEGWQ